MCPWSRKKASGPLNLELQNILSHLTRVLGMNLGPQQEQEISVSAEPSLKPVSILVGSALMFERWL